jgi:chitin disaccharide deacetylase
MILFADKEDNRNAARKHAARLLAVVADDFGVLRAIDDRILAALAAGAVTDVSVIVNTGDRTLDAAADGLRSAGAPSTGLHLCLFSGSTVPLCPVSGDAAVRCLTSDNGFFLQPSPAAMLLPWPREKLRAAGIELRAQIERYLSRGLPLHFINSHRNALMHPQLFSLCAALAAEYSVPYVRLIREKPSLRHLFSGRSLFFLLMRLHAGRCVRAARLAGVAHSDWYRGFFEGMSMSPDRLAAIVSGLKPGLTELVVHPGDDDGFFTAFSRAGDFFSSSGIRLFPLCMAGKRTAGE